MYELFLKVTFSEQSRKFQAVFQVLRHLWKKEKYEIMGNISFYSTENINEGFQIVNHNWSQGCRQYVQTMDIQKCYDSIQLVYNNI